MRAMVTGCAGFVGSHLTERLLAEGWQVTGVDAFTDYYGVADKLRNLAGALAHPRFELVQGDLVDLPLETLLADAPVVFHLAGQPGVRGSFGLGFDQYVHHNVTATQRVLEAAAATGVPRVVYASSSSVYGDADAYPCVEATTQTRPRSPYGVTKRTCEDMADVFRSFGVSSVGLRYFTVYGPRQRPDMAMRRLCEAAFGGPRFTLYADGGQSRDFTHVADAVDATIRAAVTDVVAPVLNIGGGNEATMTEVVELIESITRRPLDLVHGPDQAGDVRRTGGDTTLARTQLGWCPAMELEAGLRSELDWVRARRDAIAGSRELALR